MPKCTSLSEHGMKLTQMRREMSTFHSIEVNENSLTRLCCRCNAISEDATPAGCRLTATDAQEVVAGIAIIVLLETKKLLN